MRETITEYNYRGRATKTIVREFTPLGEAAQAVGGDFVTRAELAEIGQRNEAFIVKLQEGYNARVAELADQVNQLKTQVRALQGLTVDVEKCREQLRDLDAALSRELWRFRQDLKKQKAQPPVVVVEPPQDVELGSEQTQGALPLRERLNRVVGRYGSINHDARTGIREGQGQPGHNPGP